jgi:fatty acid desaturase
VAPAPGAAAGPPGLRGDAPLKRATFRVEPSRLYEVSPRGTAWTEGDPAEAASRLRRMRWLFAIGITVNTLTWTAAGAALVLGGRGWGAAFGLLAVLTAPLLALPALAEAAARYRARRSHRRRSPDFPRA